MRTTISIDDQLMAHSAQVAKWLGISRSQLVAQALADYLPRIEGDAITTALNRVYDAEPCDLPDDIAHAYLTWIEDEGW